MSGSDGLSSSSSLLICGKSCRCQAENPLNTLSSFTRPALSPARRIGAALVFERLWQETGCRAVVASLAGSRQHDFPLERAVFLTVLHRLFSGGSDRAADRWRRDYRIEE